MNGYNAWRDLSILCHICRLLENLKFFILLCLILILKIVEAVTPWTGQNECGVCVCVIAYIYSYVVNGEDKVGRMIKKRDGKTSPCTL